MLNVGLSINGPGMEGINRGIAALEGADVLVGIPEGDDRKQDLLDRAAAIKLTPTGKLSKTAQNLIDAANGPISNAELLFIFSNGSPLRGQESRPAIEPAIESDPTRDLIAKELAASAVAALDGDEDGMIEHLDRAGQIGESASKRWFTDPRNGWEPNKPSTIRAKGSDTPGIDTGQMRRAITHVVEAGAGIHGGNAAEMEPGTKIEWSSADAEASEIADIAETAVLV